MYTHIEGRLIESTPTEVVIDVHGVGYTIAIPVHLFSRLPPVESKIKVFTLFVLREFSQALYGFLDRRERDLFALLIEAKGVGPKMALSLLGHLPFDALLRAIRMHDTAALSRVPGVGKKTAERLLVELHDKVATWGGGASLSHAGPIGMPPVANDAVTALVNLGYSPAVAQAAVKRGQEELGAEAAVADLIKAALAHSKKS